MTARDCLGDQPQQPTLHHRLSKLGLLLPSRALRLMCCAHTTALRHNFFNGPLTTVCFSNIFQRMVIQQVCVDTLDFVRIEIGHTRIKKQRNNGHLIAD